MLVSKECTLLKNKTLNIPSSTVYIIVIKKNLKNVDKSLSSKDESQFWMLVIFGPSGAPTLRAGLVLFWTQEHSHK